MTRGRWALFVDEGEGAVERPLVGVLELRGWTIVVGAATATRTPDGLPAEARALRAARGDVVVGTVVLVPAGDDDRTFVQSAPLQLTAAGAPTFALVLGWFSDAKKPRAELAS